MELLPQAAMIHVSDPLLLAATLRLCEKWGGEISRHRRTWASLLKRFDPGDLGGALPL